MSILSLTLPNTLLDDKSVGILDQITGLAKHIVDGNNAPITTAFSKMMLHFNEALLGFGLLIFAILLFVGTMNTAADGQFLGRNWNSVWTPVRLILGILFVVPLKTGFCVAQYLFLYLILIGVHIGTYVWNEVVQDVFSEYTPPAIPSYIANYAQTAVESQMLFKTIGFMNAKFGVTSGTASTIEINTTEYVGALSPSVLRLLNTGIINDSCNKLYSDERAKKGCESAVSVALSGGQNGQPQRVSGLNGETTVWIGNGDSLAMPQTLTSGLNYNPNGWLTPNGAVKVDGLYSYDYTYEKDDKNKIGEGDNVAKAMEKNLDTLLGSKEDSAGFINKNILNIDQYNSSTGDVKNLCLDNNNRSNANCSLAGISNQLIASSQSIVEENAQKRNEEKECTTTTKIVDGKPREIKICTLEKSLKSYEANGMPIVDPLTGKPELDEYGYQKYTKISIPLMGSWWNAGQAYLLLDDHFSKNLQELINAIQKNTLLLTGENKFTGKLIATTQVMVMEAGNEYLDGAINKSINNGDQRVVDALNHCYPAVSTYVDTPEVPETDTTDYIPANRTISNAMSCGFGSMMLRPAHKLRVVTREVNIAEVGGTGSWVEAVSPYNPDLEVPNSSNTAAVKIYNNRVQTTNIDFYNELLSIPPAYQVPIQLMLTAASAQSSQVPSDTAENCKAQKGNCYLLFYPYLVNIVNVLAANGLINIKTDTLPVNLAMNSMFVSLLGAEDAKDARLRSVNSIMQDVYNFGIEGEGNIIRQQFSLIQQVRDTGIGMIISCLGSLQVVYGSFQAQMEGMVNDVIAKTNNPMAIAAKASAGGAAGLYLAAGAASFKSQGLGAALGFLGQASQMTSQILQSQIELSIATTTITTLSNIGVQMMWLPLFICVMTSLFMAGVQFALVVPFMPYIMFWAGQIAWVIGVLEAMIAAPLVMLAFAHPGGSEHMGHAAPAVRFLIGVIFRPVLMVIGLIVGILLTYILIHYSAEGFHIIASSVFSSLPTSNTMFMGVMSCILLFSYASFLVMAFTKCFSPIYVIPEKVVQWINGHAEAAGAQESQQFASGVQQNAQQGAQAGGQTLQAGVQAQKDKGSQMSELSKQEFTKGAGGTDSLNKAGDTAAQTGGTMMSFKKNKDDALKR